MRLIGVLMAMAMASCGGGNGPPDETTMPVDCKTVAERCE